MENSYDETMEFLHQALKHRKKDIYDMILHKTSNDYIDKLREIEDGWDGAVGLKPTEETLVTVKFLLDLLDDDVLQGVNLFPSNEGGVYIQAHSIYKCTIYVKDQNITGNVKVQVRKL